MVNTIGYILLLSLTFPAMVMAEPRYQLYSPPEAPKATESDHEKNCTQLEQEIASLTPLTYSTQPSIYKDPYVGTALTVGVLAYPVAYAYLAYPIVFEHYERDQIGDINRRIEALRHVKASKHCFED